jgi:antitoxin component of MazEF toxin-antitoxin module
MIRLTVKRFGKSLGVILPKKVLSRLRTGEGQSVFLIEAAGSSYRLTPHDPSFRRKMVKAEEIIGRYQGLLHRLAKREGPA